MLTFTFFLTFLLGEKVFHLKDAFFLVFSGDEIPVDSFFDGGGGDKSEPLNIVVVGEVLEHFQPVFANAVGVDVEVVVVVQPVELVVCELIHFECSGVDGDGFIFFGEFFFVAFGTNE